jgi:hypothetical protein
VGETVLQQLRTLHAFTGEHIRHRVFDEVQMVSAGELACTVIVRTHKVRETARGYQVLKAGTKMIAWTRDSVSENWTRREYIAWDEETEPYFHRTIGRSKSVQETRESEKWADMCYRPGTDKSPMDGPNAIDWRG